MHSSSKILNKLFAYLHDSHYLYSLRSSEPCSFSNTGCSSRLDSPSITGVFLLQYVFRLLYCRMGCLYPPVVQVAETREAGAAALTTIYAVLQNGTNLDSCLKFTFINSGQ